MLDLLTRNEQDINNRGVDVGGDSKFPYGGSDTHI